MLEEISWKHHSEDEFYLEFKPTVHSTGLNYIQQESNTLNKDGANNELQTF